MFDNKFTKRDALTESVKQVMLENEIRRQVEFTLNEQLGIHSKNALPHEQHAQYDAMLNEAIKDALKEGMWPKKKMEEEHPPYSEKQKRLARLGPGNPEEIDAEDLGRLRKGHAHKVGLEEVRKFPGRSAAARASSQEREAMQKRGPDTDPASLETKEGKKVNIIRQRMLAIQNRKQKLEEKATEAQNEKIAKVMGEFKRRKLHSGSKKGPIVTSSDQAKAIALNQAGISKNRKMEESLESIHEEIRNTLWEKLDYVYENYGEEAAMEAYASLTEEEQAILNERAWGQGATERGISGGIGEPRDTDTRAATDALTPGTPVPSSTSAYRSVSQGEQPGPEVNKRPSALGAPEADGGKSFPPSSKSMPKTKAAPKQKEPEENWKTRAFNPDTGGQP